jgi:hypothetical protein
MLFSAIRRRRRRRSNGNQIIHTRRNWSLKGEAYTESEAIGGYATSVNADGTVVVNAGRNASNAPFLNVGRWNNTSFSWNYTKINLTAQDGEIVTSISDNGNVIAVGFEGLATGYSSNTNVIVYEWNASSWSQRGLAITTRSYYCSIDISGDGSVLAIGEPYADISRRVRVFKWSGSSWNAHGNIITVAGAGSNEFGWKVSLNGSGDTVAVGTASTNSGVDIYRLSGGTWSQLGNRSQYSTGAFSGSDAVKLDSSGDFVAIAGYLSLSTNTGTVRVFRWTGSTWTKVGTDISQSGNYVNDEPDVSLSMDGTASRIIVGTRRHIASAVNDTINVYDWNGIDWELSASIMHATQSNFGYNPKLSRDGQTMTFGAPNTKVSAVYTTNSIWSQLGQDIDGTIDFDRVGENISMNDAGNRIVFGTNYSNRYGSVEGSGRGYTRILEYNTSTQAWMQLGQDIIGEFIGDQSGVSVDISAAGNRVVIGANYNDGNGTNSGHVRIYEYNSSTQAWAQLGQDINGEAAADQIGFSVSINAAGNRVAIGAPYNDGNGINSGHVRIYEYNSSTQTWAQLGQDINGESYGDTSGVSVSINAVGNRVAIGAPSNVANSGNLSGHVRIYEYNSSTQTWAQLGQDVDGAAGANTGFGANVYMNVIGDRFVVGIPNAPNSSNPNNYGAVRVYSWNSSSSSWAQLGQDINGIASQDRFGDSIGINATGTRIIIGAGLLSQENGKTRVYEYKESTQLWTQIGQSIDGENPTMYTSGSVSINSIGDIIVIGTPYNNGNGFVRGQVRVYRLT